MSWLRRRRKRRSKRAKQRQPMVELVSAEIDELFGPSKKHVYERKEWVAVAKVDDHEASGGSGMGPIDLDSGVVRLPSTPKPAEG